MSSYFLGGFSAYLIEPSGRQSNHSGCSLIQGWSGAAWMANTRRPQHYVIALALTGALTSALPGALTACGGDAPTAAWAPTVIGAPMDAPVLGLTCCAVRARAEAPVGCL